MNKFLVKLLGVNWKTTLGAIGMLSAVAGKILLAYRTKDFVQILTSGQELTVDIALLAGALGLLKARDSNVVGVGDAAKVISSDGTQTQADGTVIDPSGRTVKE